MPGNIRTAEELVDKIQAQEGRQMTREEMLAALVDNQKIAKALDLVGSYQDVSPEAARAHESASEIAEEAYNRVTAGEMDDRFSKPEIPTLTRSRNDDMEMEM